MGNCWGSWRTGRIGESVRVWGRDKRGERGAKELETVERAVG